MTEGLHRVVVTRSTEVQALCEKCGIPVLHHALPFRSDTVRLGLEYLLPRFPSMSGCMFLPGDQPLLTRKTLCGMAAAFCAEPRKRSRIFRLCEPQSGTPGSPVLFGADYFEELRSKTQFDTDPRVKFVGTVYDQDLLKYIRKEAFAYIHGHEVGGTNPGLLEAMAQTDLNLVLGVSFNRSVAQDTACYWEKDEGNLSHLIDQVDDVLDYSELGKLAKENMKQNFTWKKIVGEYEELFLS